MSHVASVELVVQDIDALEVACKVLGLTFKRNQKTWKWYGRFMADYDNADSAYKHGINTEDYGKGEHAIGVPGTEYEVGVCRNHDGNLSLVYDFYGPGEKIKQALGKGLEKLKQEYAAAVATKKLQRKGLRVQRRVLANGTVQLVGVR
jgi:hypothetical protein